MRGSQEWGVGFVMGGWKIFKVSIAFLSKENNIL